jgi:precorrin-6Y C5,15-methyltransferase (decarboxylating) (EC 2.1.1.132)
LALSWDGTTPTRLADLLSRRGLGPSRLTVLEAMGGPRERRRSARADAFDIEGIDPLNLVAVGGGGGARRPRHFPSRPAFPTTGSSTSQIPSARSGR